MEILVVISIISMFSSLLIANYRRDEKSRQLKNNSLLVLDGIKKAQTLSFSGREVNGQYPSSYSFVLNSCVGNCSFTVRANINGSTEDIEQVSIPNDNISINLENDASVLEVEFYPPRGNTDIVLGETSVDTALIFVDYYNVDEYYCLSIDRISGRMDVTANCLRL